MRSTARTTEDLDAEIPSACNSALFVSSFFTVSHWLMRSCALSSRILGRPLLGYYPILVIFFEYIVHSTPASLNPSSFLVSTKSFPERVLERWTIRSLRYREYICVYRKVIPCYSLSDCWQRWQDRDLRKAGLIITDYIVYLSYFTPSC